MIKKTPNNQIQNMSIAFSNYMNWLIIGKYTLSVYILYMFVFAVCILLPPFVWRCRLFIIINIINIWHTNYKCALCVYVCVCTVCTMFPFRFVSFRPHSFHLIYEKFSVSSLNENKNIQHEMIMYNVNCALCVCEERERKKTRWLLRWLMQVHTEYFFC